MKPPDYLVAVMLTVAFTASGPASDAGTLTVLHSFQQNGTDGIVPQASLLSAKNNLYGTTLEGGTSNLGIIFSVQRSTGRENVLHSFGESPDGAAPLAALSRLGGKLYGTTEEGGPLGEGTVFSFDRATGSESIVYSFQDGNGDGETPRAAVLGLKSSLYGTTAFGGGHTFGTIFSINLATGNEAVLYSFCSQRDCVDGMGPNGLIYQDHRLFGTPGAGGGPGLGTIFSFDPAKAFLNVLYAFKGRLDGAYPAAALIDVGGTLYGTTTQGGSNNVCNDSGCGTVFSFALKSQLETVLHAFSGGTSDGAFPSAALLDVGGMLYGTTAAGGVSDLGTIFAIDPSSGEEQVLYSFSGSDGANPDASLINVGGVLYGTTNSGGAYNVGTVFEFKP